MARHTSLSTRRADIGTLYFVALLREELGRRIQKARNAADLTQDELAKAIGLKHAQDVSRYERGKTDVPSFRIDRIAEATGKPRSFFMRDPAEPELPGRDPERAAQADLEDLRETVHQLSDQLAVVVPLLQRLLERDQES